MRRSIHLILISLFLLLAGCAAPGAGLNPASPYRDPADLEKGRILHVATGRILSEKGLLNYLSCYRVIFVGETHDSLDDHRVELAVFQGLYERHPGRLALGLEMLPWEAQAALDEYMQGKTDDGTFMQVWARYWGDSFPYYQEILHYARDHRIKVLALNADDDLKEAVRHGPLEDLEPDLAARLPAMDLNDPYHRAMTMAIFDAHHMGPQNTEAFYRVQVLWDEAMAERAADYLKGPERQERQLLIFAGGHHVRYGYGIPRRLFRRAPLPYVIVLPFAVEIPKNKQDRIMDVKEPVLPMPPADFLWAVGYTDLDDLKKAPGP